jgi:hypothetical protein
VRYAINAGGRHHLERDGEDLGAVAWGLIRREDAGDPYRWSLSSHLEESPDIRSGSAGSIAAAVRQMIAAASAGTAVLNVDMRISRHTAEDYDSAELTPMPAARVGTAIVLLSDDAGLPERVAGKLMGA